MENKKIAITLSTVFLIIAIIVIIIMGYVIYVLYNSNSSLEAQLLKIKEKAQKVETMLNNIQDTLNSTNTTLNSTTNGSLDENTVNTDNSSTNISADSDKEQARTVAKLFVEAINSSDWDSVEKYSDTQIANLLKEYNVRNVVVDFSELPKRLLDYETNEVIGYYYSSNYDFYYDGSSNKKDVSLGYGISLETASKNYVVNSFGPTGLNGQIEE